MTLTQAIERAKSALEERIRTTEAGMQRANKESEYRTLRETRNLDTEALAALREWKPEEKES